MTVENKELRRRTGFLVSKCKLSKSAMTSLGSSTNGNYVSVKNAGDVRQALSHHDFSDVTDFCNRYPVILTLKKSRIIGRLQLVSCIAKKIDAHQRPQDILSDNPRTFIGSKCQKIVVCFMVHRHHYCCGFEDLTELLHRNLEVVLLSFMEASSFHRLLTLADNFASDIPQSDRRDILQDRIDALPRRLRNIYQQGYG